MLRMDAAPEEPDGLSLGNPAPLNFANGMLEMEPPHTIALSLSSTSWTSPPSFGTIEAALMAGGRTQHRIWRVEVGPQGAVARVHPDDVQRCVGTIQQGDIQVCPKSLPPQELPIRSAPPRLLRRACCFEPTASATFGSRGRPLRSPTPEMGPLFWAPFWGCPARDPHGTHPSGPPTASPARQPAHLTPPRSRVPLLCAHRSTSPSRSP